MHRESHLKRLFQLPHAQITVSGFYLLGRPVVVPNHIRELTLGPNAELNVVGNHSALIRRGSVEFQTLLTDPVLRGDTHVCVQDSSKVSVGDTILISGADVVSHSNDRPGYMRTVSWVLPKHIGFDRPIPRSLVLSPRISIVVLAPRLSINGSGRIRSATPLETTQPLVEFFAVREPVLDGPRLRDSGGSGVAVVHCMAGKIDAHISDLLDEPGKYYGYGVNVSGATSDLEVGGLIEKVRHAVTTNTGPLIAGVGWAGEPESCLFRPRAVNCSNKSVDTHRLGWDIRIWADVSGGGGGVQVRADGVRILGGTIDGSFGPGLFVSSVVAKRAKVTGVKVTNLASGETGLLCQGPVSISNVTITGKVGTGLDINSFSMVKNVRISAPGGVGVRVRGSYNDIQNVLVTGRRRHALVEGAHARHNVANVNI